MRVIVPLQGVVQGRGGLVLGSVIPCALFYFLQLYLKRNRSREPRPPSPSSSAEHLPEVPGLQRTHSRAHLSPRGPGGPAHLSGRVNAILRGGDSSDSFGVKKYLEDAYDELSNPDGVIQLGLAENKVGFFSLVFWCWINFSFCFDFSWFDLVE